VVETARNMGIAVDPDALIANDSDLDGNETLAVTGVTDAVGGNVEMVGDAITFTPEADTVGLGGFSYVLSDGVASVLVPVVVKITGEGAGPAGWWRWAGHAGWRRWQ